MMNSTTRREKSLTTLCQKFLKTYPRFVDPNKQEIVYLDLMVKKLGVERRRIYDIVNVLESVEVLSRHAKNQYLWHGFNRIELTLAKLKTLSLKTNFLDYAKRLMESQLEPEDDLHEDERQARNVCFEANTGTLLTSSSRRIIKKDATTQTFNVSREEKSLGVMCQKFLMLFLTSEDGVVSINFAARVLLGDTKNDITEHGRFKTKVRRLYDIANVLVSIRLIEKHHGSNVSKPAYRFIGPSVNVIREAEYVSDFVNQENTKSNSKHSLFDHFKRKLDLKSKVPNFDIHTGTLNSKDNVVKIENIEQPNSTLECKLEQEEFPQLDNYQLNDPYSLYTSSSSSSSLASHVSNYGCSVGGNGGGNVGADVYSSTMCNTYYDGIQTAPVCSIGSWQQQQQYQPQQQPAVPYAVSMSNSFTTTNPPIEFTMSTTNSYYALDDLTGVWTPLPSFSTFF